MATSSCCEHLLFFFFTAFWSYYIIVNEHFIRVRKFDSLSHPKSESKANIFQLWLKLETTQLENEFWLKSRNFPQRKTCYLEVSEPSPASASGASSDQRKAAQVFCWTQWAHMGSNKEQTRCKSMVIFRDFSFNSALFGLVIHHDPCKKSTHFWRRWKLETFWKVFVFFC